MEAGASLYHCTAPASWGNMAQEKQFPHMEVSESAAKGQNSQGISVKKAQITLQFFSVQ